MIKNGKPYIIEATYRGCKLVGIAKWVKRIEAHHILIHGVCNMNIAKKGDRWEIESGVEIIDAVVQELGKQLDAQFEFIDV